MQNNKAQFHAKALLTIALTLLSLNASAGAMADPEQNVANWTGFYFGLDYMAGDVTMKKSYSGTSFNPNTGVLISTFSGNINQSFAGSLANLFLGYNFQPQTSRFIYGLELEGAVFRDLSFASEAFVNAVPAANSLYLVIPETINSMFSAVGHVGFLVQPTTQIYGVIGLTEAAIVNAATNAPLYPESFREQWVAGLGAGLGVEHKISNNWSVLAEYRHTRFDFDRSANRKATNVNSSTNGASSTKIDMDMGRVGIVYRPSVA
jgi:opacity protein-like surface antigen